MLSNSFYYLQALVDFMVTYISPDDAAGNFDPSNLIKPIQQNSSSMDDDQQMLLDIEQNIANLERSLHQGIFFFVSIFKQKIFHFKTVLITYNYAHDTF